MIPKLKGNVEALKRLPLPANCIYTDIETDGLLYDDVTQIHAICFTMPDGTQLSYSTLAGDDTIDQAINFLKAAVVTGRWTPVFHNGAGYDLNILYKFYPSLKDILTVENTVDTMLLSCILQPDRSSGHSLDAWGEDLGIPKVQNYDWSTCTKHMVNRCLVDTDITRRVYETLYAQAYQYDLNVLWNSLTLESAVSMIHQNQVNYGVLYDLSAALEHYNTLGQEIIRLQDSIQQEAPWSCEIVGVAKKNQKDVRKSWADDAAKARLGYREVQPFKKDGNYTKVAENFWGDKVDQVKGSYVKIECTPLDIGNSAQVKEYLSTLGWKPTEWNYSFEGGRKVRKSPKLTEDSYASLPPGLGQDIALFRTYQHRQRSIMNIDEKTGETKGAVSKVREDGRIGAEAFTCGTPTARYRHAGTVCNIPRPSSVFGTEIRETFCVDPEHWMLGMDLSGIEARMLAHYLKDYPGSEDIIKAILNANKGSDFHSRNAKIWGVDRNTAKSGLYALLYGCYPKKLATTLGYDEAHGQKLFDDFWSFNEPIKLLMDDLEKSFAHNRGWVTGLDGRPLFIREKRKLLNTLLQNAATMIFKRWMIMADEYMGRVNVINGNDVQLHQLIAYHDELQVEYTGLAHSGAVHHAMKICELSLKAGEYYNVKVPTPAEAKIGKNWAMTH